MLFNSFEFLVFLIVVYTVYWILRGKRFIQNPFLLFVSYLFYGWWDWRFLLLLLLSTLIDYGFGLLIYNSKSKKKFFLWFSIFNNLAVLFFFKYYNFFAGSAEEFLRFFGVSYNPVLIQIVLPIGISFYTFHGMSYVIDIYRGNFKPIKNFFDYSLFVSFFPLLVAGPIERATHLLPQITRERHFDRRQSVEGLRLILWGLFKKIAIADNCALIVNPIFDTYHEASSIQLITAAILFAFQIYGDFSGYSDIAKGTAKLFGIELLVNFKTPYFSRDIAEFWRRWHISLTSWFRDYIYIPLGGSKVNKSRAVINTFVIFLVSGFWHGANWTFILWGGLNALYFIPLLLTKRNRKNVSVVAENTRLPTIKELFQIGVTFLLTVIAWIFFRSATVKDAMAFITSIFYNSAKLSQETSNENGHVYLLLGLFILLEWSTRRTDFAAMCDSIKSSYLRYGLYILLIFLIGLFGAFTHSDFIYFQF